MLGDKIVGNHRLSLGRQNNAYVPAGGRGAFFRIPAHTGLVQECQPAGVNGKLVQTALAPGQYAAVNRRWKTEISLHCNCPCL